MENFITVQDDLSKKINECAVELFRKLQALPVDSLGMPYHCLAYFKGSHFKRLFFSIETSAHLLYNSITTIRKPVSDIVLMDYGAGVGTLYTLAKMIGCKKVIYNDHLDDWKLSASLIAEAIGIKVDEYIVGDIEDTLKQLNRIETSCDLIISRNVIEHIYKLDHFYAAIALAQPNACVYSSTTANYKNPASRIKHWLWHRKWEKLFLPQRMDIIKKLSPALSGQEIEQLAKLTRGKAGKDIEETVQYYLDTKKYPAAIEVRSNTCDPTNGVWFEHMLKFEEYRKLVEPSNYRLSFSPGFWDTHYSKAWMNVMGKIFNSLIRINKQTGLWLAPFIYVVAEKK